MDLVVVDKLVDTGLSLGSDCDEIIDNRKDFLAVYHNKKHKDTIYAEGNKKQ